jgi:hypothetical protein
VIKTSEALVVGGHISRDVSTGKSEFTAAQSKLLPLGFVIGQSSGDNTSLTGDGTVAAVARGGIIVSLTVTGASAITDNLKWVYASDGRKMAA